MLVKSSSGAVIKEKLNSYSDYHSIQDSMSWSKWNVTKSVWITPPTADDYTGQCYSRERIAYDKGGAYFKNCLHTIECRSSRTANRIGSTYSTSCPPGDITLMVLPVSRWPFLIDDYLPHANLEGDPEPPRTLSVDLGQALSRGHHQMYPRIEDLTGGLNLINFLFELRDLKMMFKIWRKSHGVLKNMSAGVLNLNYAWKPFIRDVRTITQSLIRLSESLDRWNEAAKAGKIYTRHADMTDCWTDQSEDLSYSTDDVNSGCNRHIEYCKKYSEEAKVYVHLAYKPNRISLSNHDKCMAYLDAIGAGDPLSIIWEAIPFSFVVDYFISVQDFVAQFDHDFFVYPISYVDFGYSIKSTQRYDVSRKVSLYCSPTADREPEPGYYIYKSYVRRRAVPPPLLGEDRNDQVDLGLLKIHRPSLRQMFLMVNLAHVVLL